MHSYVGPVMQSIDYDCFSSVLSLVQFLFSIVFFYANM